MKIYVTLGEGGRVSVSVPPPEGFLGPFEAPDDFAENQHLYKVAGDKLIYDADYAAKLAEKERQIAEESERTAAANAAYKRGLARMMAQASPEDAAALAPLLEE